SRCDCRVARRRGSQWRPLSPGYGATLVARSSQAQDQVCDFSCCAFDGRIEQCEVWSWNRAAGMDSARRSFEYLGSEGFSENSAADMSWLPRRAGREELIRRLGRGMGLIGPMHP